MNASDRPILAVDLPSGTNPDTGAEDNTHFGAFGATTVAAFVAQQLRVIRGLDDHSEPLGSWFVRP